jgi:valine dehydrogenase (NAD+)
MLKITEVDVPGYERVVQGVDETIGLYSTIAIHSTVLGPALGGCRQYHYPGFLESFEDALALGKAMTYKNSLAGLDLGGGKSTIHLGCDNYSSEDALRSFGQLVQSLEGQYITAGDVGTTKEDLAIIAQETEYCLGGSKKGGSGPATAYGVYQAMKAWAEWNELEIRDFDVAVSGVGKVGVPLIRLLLNNGAWVTAHDVDRYAITEFFLERPDFVIVPYDIREVPYQIYSPCAMGGFITQEFLDGIITPCAVIGGANNQLADPELQYQLEKSMVDYVPDYLANSGGVIITSAEKDGKYVDLDWKTPEVKAKIEEIYDRTKEVLERSAAEPLTTVEVCDMMAKERINAR